MADAGGTQRAGRWLVWIFAGIGLLAAVSMIGLAALVFSFRLGPGDDPPAQVAVAEGPRPLDVLDVREVPGTDLVRIGIGNPSGRGIKGGYSYGYDEADHRNLILLDRRTGESRKLLPDNLRRILDMRFFPAVAGADPGGEPRYVVEAAEASETKPPPPPAAYYALRVRQREGDKEDLLVGTLGTGAQGFVLTGIDGVDRMWMLDDKRLALLLREGLKLHYRVIDIPTLELVAARQVAT